MEGVFFAKLVTGLGSHYPILTIVLLGALLVLAINKTIRKYNAGDSTYKDWLRFLIFILIGFVGIGVFIYYLFFSAF